MRHFLYTARGQLGGVLLVVCGIISSPGSEIDVSPPRSILSPSQIHDFHLEFFPDGSVFEAEIGGRLYFFAANGGARNSPQQGTIVLTGHSHELRPAWFGPAGTPVPSLRSGFLEPSPGYSTFDREFDRDYAGGGTVYWDPASSKLIQIYHGEFHFDPTNPEAFYTSLGLAISSDFGRSFKKLGLAIRPELPPTLNAKMPSSSGSLVKVRDYFFLYYSDLSPDGTCAGTPSGNLPCVAVARAEVQDVISAALQGTVAPWKKYYHGDFTEPGNGGKFSPLFVTGGRTWARWPVVTSDSNSRTYYMVYSAGLTGLVLRQSSDGLSWGEPTQIVPSTENEMINYSSIIGLENSLEKGETRLCVLYVKFNQNNGVVDFKSRTLESVIVRLHSHRSDKPKG
jgi:hypothetical protein